jgi:hypothetical protein
MLLTRVCTNGDDSFALQRNTFPAEYARYRERVPLLVPGLHRLRRSN